MTYLTYKFQSKMIVQVHFSLFIVRGHQAIYTTAGSLEKKVCWSQGLNPSSANYS